nr:MAG TPA: hypothetical protein [Caudoviricetes sp.]DAZ79946.1 MAG TPA: hypothetical protein [Caudoviricetes sp.]
MQASSIIELIVPYYCNIEFRCKNNIKSQN